MKLKIGSLIFSRLCQLFLKIRSSNVCMVRSSRPRICRIDALHKQLLLRIWHAHYACSRFFSIQITFIWIPWTECLMRSEHVGYTSGEHFSAPALKIIPWCKMKHRQWRWSGGLHQKYTPDPNQNTSGATPQALLAGLLQWLCSVPHFCHLTAHYSLNAEKRHNRLTHGSAFPDWYMRSYIQAHFLRCKASILL